MKVVVCGRMSNAALNECAEDLGVEVSRNLNDPSADIAVAVVRYDGATPESWSLTEIAGLAAAFASRTNVHSSDLETLLVTIPNTDGRPPSWMDWRDECPWLPINHAITEAREPWVIIREWFSECLTTMPYAQYLKTEHWQNVRKAALERADYRCQACNEPDNLHVHHRTYENRGAERDSDVTVLCKSCHERFHGVSNGKVTHTVR